MKHKYCLKNQEAFHSQTKMKTLCNDKKHVNTKACKDFCRTPGNCTTGLTEYCKNETLKTLSKNEEKANLCGCYLTSKVYDEFKKPFLDAGDSATEYTDPYCYFPACGSSTYKKVDQSSCPDISKCYQEQNLNI